MSDRSSPFHALHRPGRPLILVNIWDVGSARAVAATGAGAVATGSASVAAAMGYADGEQVPLDQLIDLAARLVDAVDCPVTIDFEGGYAVAADALAANVARLAATGVAGCNLEDQRVGGEGLYSVAEQTARLAAVRAAVPDHFFVNARTDVFLQADVPAAHPALMAEAIDRARAYAMAGADGFFAPLLGQSGLVAKLCADSPIPINLMAYPGAPEAAIWASAGVARISHGPFPHRALMAQLADMATAAQA